MVQVGCAKPGCGHAWNYRGSQKSRVRCPKCRSARNELNWRKFGHWDPQATSKAEKKDAKKTKGEGFSVV